MTRERVALTKLRLKLYLLAEPSAQNIRHLGPADCHQAAILFAGLVARRQRRKPK